MYQTRELPTTENVLFSDRLDPDRKGHDVLGYTRNVPLANLCALCVIMNKISGQANSEWDLAEKAQNIELDKFSNISQLRGMTPRVMPTVIRRHWYALCELGLATKDQRTHLLSLTDLGKAVAQVSIESKFDFASEMPIPLKEQWAKVFVSSDYVKQFWLSFFMPTDSFDLEKLRSQNNSIFLENVPESVRKQFGDFHSDEKKWTDSGFRIYSANYSALRLLTIAGRRGIFTYDPTFLALTTVAKFEIYDGLRRWSNEIGLTDELPLDASESAEFDEKTFWPRSQVRECYVVKQYWAPDIKIMLRFEHLVENEIRSSSSGYRIRIPDLIIRICKKERLSPKNVKELLLNLRKEKSARFYFEGASPGVIEDLDSMQEFYLPIDGIWRTTIAMFAN